MAAFSASTLVCSVMSEISSTISPISCEDSPRRLIRLEVSWICSRMSFMPVIAFCTACWPCSAAVSEARATLADSAAPRDTCVMRSAISTTDSPVWRIWRDCSSVVDTSWVEVDCTCPDACVTSPAVCCTRPTSSRSSSTV
ncbi:hypothetical protein D3C81_861240 [compost metagenome]